MIYLSGVTNDRDEPLLVAAGIGLMLQPGNSYHLRAERYPWTGADNGCFGGRWDEARHLDWLEQLPRERCLFAVSPDAYPDARESFRRGLEFAPLLREMGFPVAVVAQDGAEDFDWPWDDLDVLFIGGVRQADPRREWKLGPGARRLVQVARDHGKWVHMGRVNSVRRMEAARSMGCNSADGTFLRYWRRRRARETSSERGADEVVAWLAWLHSNPTLPGLTQFELPGQALHREAALRTMT